MAKIRFTFLLTPALFFHTSVGNQSSSPFLFPDRICGTDNGFGSCLDHTIADYVVYPTGESSRRTFPLVALPAFLWNLPAAAQQDGIACALVPLTVFFAVVSAVAQYCGWGDTSPTPGETAMGQLFQRSSHLVHRLGSSFCRTSDRETQEFLFAGNSPIER